MVCVALPIFVAVFVEHLCDGPMQIPPKNTAGTQTVFKRSFYLQQVLFKANLLTNEELKILKQMNTL